MRNFLRYGVGLLALIFSLPSAAEQKEDKPFDFRIAGTRIQPHVVPLAEKSRLPAIPKDPPHLDDRQRLRFLPGAKWSDGTTDYQLGITPRKIVLRVTW